MLSKDSINPIFIEYYSHESCDCYKILDPWGKYKETKVVLCPVRDGIEKARKIAKKYLIKSLNKALNGE